MDYLSIVKSKYLSNNILPEHIWGSNMDEFVCANYFHCEPTSRGNKFVSKIVRDSGGKIKPVPKALKRGDAKINDIYYEVKNPYLIGAKGKSQGSYRIGNIRPWQDFTYFIICLVDCKVNFKPHFYVVDKNELVSHPLVKLHNQHTDAKDMKINHDANLVIQMSKEVINEILNSITILRGSTYNDFMDYVNGIEDYVIPEPHERVNHQLSLGF